MALDLSGLSTTLASALPSSQAVIESIGTSLAAGVAIAGIKAQMANGTIPDPFHLAGAGQAANANNPNQVVGPTATAAAISAMSPTAQAAFFAAGGHVVG